MGLIAGDKPWLNKPAPVAAPPPRITPATRQRAEMIGAVISEVFKSDLEFREYYHSTSLVQDTGLVDFLFAVDDDPHEPAQVFNRVRWGGQFIYICRRRRHLNQIRNRFAQRGFQIVKGPCAIRKRFLGLPIPFTRAIHYFVARKLTLVRPREISDRFTFNVHLGKREKGNDGYIVIKQVPTMEQLLLRLHRRNPRVPEARLKAQARHLIGDIFPVFLTREASTLQLLNRELPEAYTHRVPKLLDAETDTRGRVQKLIMRWMRNGGSGISQLQFAKQAAHLLMILHETVGVTHLDLRLDNMVITHNGVGFVDFGSAVRAGEDIDADPGLSPLFHELMTTSQIQRTLSKWTSAGQITNQWITRALHKVDLAVDWYFLAVQMNQPHLNPDFQGLIHFDPESREAQAISNLTAEILRPKDHSRAYRSARDILYGVEHLEKLLLARPMARMAS